jgi:hypothetical protein
MMSNDLAASGEPVVVAAQFSVAETENEIARLFEHVVHSGWLPCAASILVVRLDTERDEIAKRVADTIVAFCTGLGYVQVLLWTKDKPLPFGYAGGSASDSLALPDFRLLSACMPHGVPARTFWLAPFDLVTVTMPRPDYHCGLSAILAAQARTLADDRAWRLELIAEAHRLIRSDVAVVCGPLSSPSGPARAFCALSNDDIALEVAVGRAAGVHPLRLPHLRFLSTQYVISFDSKVIGAMPVLNGLAAPTWQTLPTHAFWRLMRYCDQARADLGLARANLVRIPDFLVRRGVLKRAMS